MGDGGLNLKKLNILPEHECWVKCLWNVFDFHANKPVHWILNNMVRYLEIPVYVLVYDFSLICHWHAPFLFR